MTTGANKRRFLRLVALLAVPAVFAVGCGGGELGTPVNEDEVGDPGKVGQTGESPFPLPKS